jgi:hypothetical protein
MRVAYIAGPYRAPAAHGIVQNIRRAEAVALKYWKLGYAVICPHKNTALFDGTCADSTWLDGDLEILARCDVIVMMKGWEKSQGAAEELQHAESLAKEVIYDDGKD